MQKAVANYHKLALEDVLESCRHQKASDQMILFVRAVCAMGLLLDPVDSLVQFQTMLEEAHVPCRFVLAVVSDVICLTFSASSERDCIRANPQEYDCSAWKNA